MAAKILQGIDIVSVPRIQKAIERGGAAFTDKIFTRREQEYCCSKRYRYEHFAARFAAKEALIKALSGATEKALNLSKIEISHHASGRPMIKLTARMLRELKLSPKTKIEISLSHERKIAVATAIVLEPASSG